MKDSNDKGTEGASHRVRKEWITVSPRKLAANRRNALKSTGPKTADGKAYSRRNAITHGIFFNRVTDFEALEEDPREYDGLLTGLWDQYQPIGKAEEIEVERIAICCWRLKRVWRYENAVNLAARRDCVRTELDYQQPYCEELDRQEQAVILQLQAAKKEIEETGAVSQEVKQRIFSTMPLMEKLWSAFDKKAPEWVKVPEVSRAFRTPQSRAQAIAMYPVRMAMACIEPLSARRWTNEWETAIGQQAIPNSDVVDKILRYETTIERSLHRAQDRLERLQRRRRGEPVPPPLSVHLSR